MPIKKKFETSKNSTRKINKNHKDFNSLYYIVNYVRSISDYFITK